MRGSEQASKFEHCENEISTVTGFFSSVSGQISGYRLLIHGVQYRLMLTTITMNSGQAQNPSDNTGRGVALVTGSSSGIGASVAIDLASIGFTVILTGRNADNLAKVEQKCNDTFNSKGFLTGKAIPYQIDFSDAEQLNGLVCFVRSKFNKLDLLVNNVCFRGEIKNILAEDACDDLQKALHMNVLIPMRLIRDCCLMTAPKMGEPASSSPSTTKSIVINVSSIAAQIAVPLHVYSITKACLTELSRQVALLGGDESGVLSVNISPGPVLTDERPHHAQMSRWTLMDRVATTQEISNLVMFLVDRAHLFNGQDITIDGGYMAKQKQS